MSDDLIRRQDAIKALIEWYGSEPSDLDAFENIIKKLSSAQPERKGKWIHGKEIAREMLCDKTICVFYENYKCSECGLILDRLLFNVDGTPFYKYCPNCGAKMDG